MGGRVLRRQIWAAILFAYAIGLPDEKEARLISVIVGGVSGTYVYPYNTVQSLTPPTVGRFISR